MDYPAAKVQDDIWTADFYTQAFIAEIGDRHGFLDRRRGRLFAQMTDYAFNENPTDPTDPTMPNQGCRLWTKGTISCQVNQTLGHPVWHGKPILEIEQQEGRELGIFQGTIDCSPNLVAGPGYTLVAPLHSVSSQSATWRLTFFGRPNKLLESQFHFFGGDRNCTKIWHRVEISAFINSVGDVKYSVEFRETSLFPSHRLWAWQKEPHVLLPVSEVPQDVFRALWWPAPPPLDVPVDFVRGRL